MVNLLCQKRSEDSFRQSGSHFWPLAQIAFLLILTSFARLPAAAADCSPAADQYIVFKQNTRTTSFEGFDLSKTRAGGVDVFRFLVSSALGQEAELHSASTLSTGVWYHVAGVRGSNFLQLYVNGQLERQT